MLRYGETFFGMVLVSGCFASAVAAVSNVTIINKTPFYLHSQNSPACIQGSYKQYADVAPGASAVIPASQHCGYDICATSYFDSSEGCQELGPKNTKVQGGYLAYVGFNNYSGTLSCIIGHSPQDTIPADGVPFIPYACELVAPKGSTSQQVTVNYQPMNQMYTSGPNSGQLVTLPAVTQYESPPNFRGVNISGMEYDGTFLDALFQHPDKPDVKSFVSAKMNTVRLPIRAEFIVVNDPAKVPSNPGPINSSYANFHAGNYVVNQMYVNAVYDTVQKYLQSGISVILDMHNYMRFCDTGTAIGQNNEPTNAALAPDPTCHIMTDADLVNVWTALLTTKLQYENNQTFSALAEQYKPGANLSSKDQLMMGVMNEPYSGPTAQSGLNKANNSSKHHTQLTQMLPTTSQVFNTEVAAAKAIRKYAPTNLIILSGNDWDGLHSWFESNASQFTYDNLTKGLDVADLSHYAIEVHQYFDSNFSGTHSECNTYKDYKSFLQAIDHPTSPDQSFASWVSTNKIKVLVTEFGASNGTQCQQDIGWMMQYINQNVYQPDTQSGFIGWTAWRANRNSVAFNALQAADYTVYGGDATTKTGGIKYGPANSLLPILIPIKAS